MPSQIGIRRYRTVCSSLPKPTHDRKLEPKAVIPAVRTVYIIILEFLNLCSVNSQEIISCYMHMLLLVAALVKGHIESQILLIVLSLPVLQVSDGLIGVTCS